MGGLYVWKTFVLKFIWNLIISCWCGTCPCNKVNGVLMGANGTQCWYHHSAVSCNVPMISVFVHLANFVVSFSCKVFSAGFLMFTSDWDGTATLFFHRCANDIFKTFGAVSIFVISSLMFAFLLLWAYG